MVPETSNLKQRIFEEYLVDKWKPEDTRIKLKPVKNDQTAFGKLFADPTEHIRKSNLTVNYDYFYERIQKQENSIDQLCDAICCLEIINIRLDMGDNPQLIVESLNSTGLIKMLLRNLWKWVTVFMYGRTQAQQVSIPS